MKTAGRGPLGRLAAMDRKELEFRLASEAHKAAGLARWTVARPRWNRADLSRILAPAGRSQPSHLARGRECAGRGDWLSAHQALASHFATRQAGFPLDATALPGLAARIRARFPDAAATSAARAERILEGRYDILGYAGLPFGSPPRWDYDPVHNRTAAGGFWASVPYLDPVNGDHKIIWELNRHQHWLALGRAFHLTSDRRFYDEFVRQLHHWMGANPPLAGVNWASMLELAFRSLSWIWTLHFFAAQAQGAENGPHPWTVDLLVGIDRQLVHVEQNLSRYFSPNTHLTGEALALYVAGATLPELAASPRRLALGREVLLSEIDRQVLADGGHAERSAHYHRYSTDFYLLATLVARGTADSAVARFEEAAHRQARYLRAMADDAGRLPLIGDDDGGLLFPIGGRDPAHCADTLANAALILGDPELTVGEAPEETYWLCGSALPVEQMKPVRLLWPSTPLRASGYCVSRNDRGDHLILDAGPHGFLNGGHAHSDALSVVLTLAGRPVLVDPGTATYTMDAAVRDRFRSTAMHNTVVLNGRAQSEPEGPFHWRTRTDASLSVWRSANRVDYAEGRHAGYAPAHHARAVLAVDGVGWFIVDHLLGQGDSVADGYWHIHPDWQVTLTSPASAALQHHDGSVHRIAASAPMATLTGSVAPIYGRVEPSTSVRTRTAGALPQSMLTFMPSVRSQSDVTVEVLPLQYMPPSGWHGAAFGVRVAGTEIILLAATEGGGREQADEDAAPGVIWGSPSAQTDARVALLIVRDGVPHKAVLINGRRLEAPNVKLNLEERSAVARVSLEPSPAQPFSGLNRASEQ
jgi:hypothetical protein